MRTSASILHLDLDAFFAAVEQRDKPSLRGKPVVVGGSGPRGVVATASYEARRFGVRSAMSGTEARRRAPNAAFLGGRFEAYRQSSEAVMALLREVSPLVEPLSFDEAYVDLTAGSWDLGRLDEHVEWLRAEVRRRTAGLTASVGVSTSMFLAKLGSEAAKPDGYRIIRPGEELDFIAPLPVRAVPGVGPVTEQRLLGIGIATIAELRAADERELVRELGRAAGESLFQLAFAEDDRQVQAERETKSISTEDTFPVDIADREQLVAILRRDAAEVARRVRKAGMFARTVGIKVRMGDFTTITRARSLGGATDEAGDMFAVAAELLAEVDVRDGVRLLGIGASNFTRAAQEQLFDASPGSSASPTPEPVVAPAPDAVLASTSASAPVGTSATVGTSAPTAGISGPGVVLGSVSALAPAGTSGTSEPVGSSAPAGASGTSGTSDPVGSSAPAGASGSITIPGANAVPESATALIPGPASVSGAVPLPTTPVSVAEDSVTPTPTGTPARPESRTPPVPHGPGPESARAGTGADPDVRVPTSGVRGHGYYPGADVVHDRFGRGWVWGLGRGLVTVRFETRDTPPGPVRTFPEADPALRPAPDLPDLPGTPAPSDRPDLPCAPAHPDRP